jgi:glycosyltransferase involved in cell wall biosynthesis
MLKHSAWAGVGAAQASGIPVVLRPEGSGLTGDIAWQRQALGGRWIARRCRAAAAFVALSPHIRAELEQAGYPADRIWDIANGVPIPDLPADFGQDASGRRAGSIPVVSPDCERDAARQKLGINASGPIVLFIGRLSPEKGLFDLLAAWDRVCAELPAAALVIVGDGPQAAELRQLAAKQASIHLAGATDQPQRYLRAADLFVLPSHEEGMSVALLEAMAAGVPAVACDIPGNRGLIESGRHGLLVPPRRPTQIAQAILAQLQARSVAGAMARAARERVAEEFSIGRMARRHLELFESLLQDRRKAEQSASS